MIDTEQSDHSAPNPAADAARAEMQAIMTDSSHPMHNAYQRGDTETWQRHIQPFYNKAAGGAPSQASPSRDKATETPPIEVNLGDVNLGTMPEDSRGDEPAPSQEKMMSPEERAYIEEYDTRLHDLLGEDFETTLQDARLGAAKIFGTTPEGLKAYQYFVQRFTELGPQYGSRALCLMAELNNLLNAQQGRSA